MAAVNNHTTARVLLQAGGLSGNVVGMSMSAVGTMYLMRYVIEAGCATVEFLPHILAADGTTDVHSHFGARLSGGWAAVFKCGGVVLAGIICRKVGTMLSSDATIGSVERFMYQHEPETQ
jgi:hypothetical protein